MGPIVSVIIPNYNHEKFLAKRIDSVLAQSYQDFEIIILDDCSTDGSRTIIDRYKDHPKVSVIQYNDHNSGSTFRQWLKGVDLAGGKYIWIAESDDYADADFLLLCVNGLLENPNSGIVYTDSYEVNDEDLVAGRWSRWQERQAQNLWTKNFTESGRYINSSYNYIANVIPNASCAVFRKELFLNSAFREHIRNLKYTGDWIMWFSMLMNADLVYCHRPLNYFRYHPNTTRYRADLRLQNVSEQYSALRLFKNLCKTDGDKAVEEERFKELFSTWNPVLTKLLGPENRPILKKGFAADRRLIRRLFQKMVKRAGDLLGSRG